MHTMHKTKLRGVPCKARNVHAQHADMHAQRASVSFHANHLYLTELRSTHSHLSGNKASRSLTLPSMANRSKFQALQESVSSM